MSGAVKVGLLFGLIGLIAGLLPLPPLLDVQLPRWLVVVLLQVIPVLLLFGPLALVVGAFAGYFGTRRSVPPTMPRGLLAGGLAGTGVLFGIVTFFATITSVLTSDPNLQQQLVTQVSEQWSQQGGDPAVIASGFGALMIGAGMCAGLLNLLLALGVAALGSLLAQRQALAGAKQRGA